MAISLQEKYFSFVICPEVVKVVHSDTTGTLTTEMFSSLYNTKSNGIVFSLTVILTVYVPLSKSFALNLNKSAHFQFPVSKNSINQLMSPLLAQLVDMFIVALFELNVPLLFFK